MRRVSIAEAKAHLSELIEQAMAGEQVEITKRGTPVARISSVVREKKPVDVAALKALTDSMPKQSVNAGEFVRWLRDTDRY